jgi:CRISPR/Cas system-associated exonuclease Cas4 (RecB family)
MDLITKIDNYLLSRASRKRTSHYPSDMGTCKRQMWYKWKDIEKTNPIEAGALWKMEIGNGIHDLVHGFLKDSGMDIIAEVEFKEKIEGLEYPISGRVDNLFVDDEGKTCGIEVKTSFGRGIVEIQKTRTPRPEHITQIATYLYFTNIEKFYLVYVGRDNAYRTQFLIQKIEDKILTFYDGTGEVNLISRERLINDLKTIEKNMSSLTPPPREHVAVIKNKEIKSKIQHKTIEHKSDWQCVYCGWGKLCWKDVLEKEGIWKGAESLD